jgi:hypothetical protein
MLMKKNLLLFTCLLSVCFVNAQFSAGQKLIGGQFAISLVKSNEKNPTPGTGSNQFLINFSPSIARFKTPNLLTGAGFFYSYEHYVVDVGGPAERTDDSHSFGLFINRTKLETLARKFYFTYTGTAGANYQVGHSYFASGATNTDSDGYTIYVSGGIGLMYQLNQRFLLSFGLVNLLNLSYYHGAQTRYVASGNTYESKMNGFNLSTSFTNINLNSVSVGVRYLLK